MTLITFTPTALGTLDDQTPYSSGTIVGGQSALDVADEDTAYIQADGTTDTFGDEAVSFVPVPDKPTPPVEKVIRIWWSAQFRLMEPPVTEFAQDYTLFFSGESISGNYAEAFGVPPTHSTTWVTTSTTPYDRDTPGAFQWIEELYNSWAFDPTLVSAVAPIGTHIQMSWLRLYAEVEGDIPTRVYPRADGLGMGAPRLMDGRSPYRSSRVFGAI